MEASAPGGQGIDLVLGSPALARRVTDARIDREECKGKGASHTPRWWSTSPTSDDGTFSVVHIDSSGHLVERDSSGAASNWTHIVAIG